MAETKPTRRRKPRRKVEAIPKAEDNMPDTIQPKVEPEIKVSKAKVLPKDKKYTKVVAIRSSSGRMGNERFSIKEGQTYNFPTELAKWLIETGRAK